MHEEESKSLAWEITKEQSGVTRLALKVLVTSVIVFGVTISVVVGCFLHYLGLYDYSTVTYEQTSTLEAISEDGGDANAIMYGNGEVLANGDSEN